MSKTENTMRDSDETRPLSLFGDDPLAAFEAGTAGALVAGRNPHLGNLFNAERAVAYVTILYRMLLFKREHELEPLYEDLYRAVEPVLRDDRQPYPQDQFRTDLGQLAAWDLVGSRIEKQRLRGYRDNRKRKFRYRLADEAAALLAWLEERLQDDMEERGGDARDLLGEVCGTLSELFRLVHLFRPDGEGAEETARRILFQLGRADDLCRQISEALIDLNGRLLSFVLRRYEVEEVRIILAELDGYVQTFLRQAFVLRREIEEMMGRFDRPVTRKRIEAAFAVMERERLRAPHFLRIRRERSGLAIPDRLVRFFADRGGLDHLLNRINDTSLQVWQKLRSHLQELERKNHRLEDLRDRIAEIAGLDEGAVPRSFMEELLAYGHGWFDLNYWDGREKAEPPRPARRIARREKEVRSYLQPKKKIRGRVQSMEEARLEELGRWIGEKILSPPALGRPGRAEFGEFADFARLLELARAGILDEGRKLARISCSLRIRAGRERIRAAACRLDIPAMTVRAEGTPPLPEEEHEH